MELIAIARLVRVRGNRGELAAEPFGADPTPFRQVIVNGATLDVEQIWKHGDKLIFKFRGIDTISDASALAGADVCIPKDQRPVLPEGEYYQSDLVGYEVIERATGRNVGRVTGWQEYGAAPLLEVETPNAREILVPFAQSICVHIHSDARRIEVDLPEGLDEL